MKFLLTTLNSKYIHTSLSLRCLYASSRQNFDVSFCEYTINDNIKHITGDIYKKFADVICFSCYIWNFRQTMDICEDLKSANPNLKIFLGGPEVTYTAKETMDKYDFIDGVVIGEGEITIRELFYALKNNISLDTVNGITFRENGKIIENLPRLPVQSLDMLPFPYDDSIDEYKNKIIYYETSRGCPFSCSYCLSGERGGVRYLSIERVKRDIDFFIDKKVPLVKLVDRTFNANPKRAKEIFTYIIKNSKETRFHTELAGDLIDDELIQILQGAPKDILQFEIGVQTTNEKTMEAINRKIKWEPLKKNILKLIKTTNIHIHLDLIAGLPFEDIKSFEKSFNDVLDLKPHVLQLGFLKMLKGSQILDEKEKYGYKYTKNAPYEVICNNFVSYDDILKLHDIDFVFDKYYNSGSFKNTLHCLFEKYNNEYFKLFSDLARFFYDENLFDISLSKYDLYDIIYRFSSAIGIDIKDFIKHDFLLNVKSHNLPEWARVNRDKEFLDNCYTVLKDENFKKDNLPHYYDVPAKAVIKNVIFESVNDKILLFDKKSDVVLDVTKYF